MEGNRDVPLLSGEMLAEYGDRLRVQGLPIDEHSYPGLETDEINRALAPLRLRLPAEACILWEWKNGASWQWRQRLFGPGKEILPLVESVKLYRQCRKTVEENVDPDVPLLSDPHIRWAPSWLPITGPQLPIVIDCAVAEQDPTPVRFIDFQDIEWSREVKAESLGQMVAWWIEALDRGAWRWDVQQARWTVHRELLNAELLPNPLLG